MTAAVSPLRPVALQRCYQFVGRTENWIYDHLRSFRHYRPVVACDVRQNREEFAAVEAWSTRPDRLERRIWRRVAGDRVFPLDAVRLRSLSPRVLHSHFGTTAAGDFALQEKLAVPWFVGFYGADLYQLGRDPVWQSAYRRVFDAAHRVLALGPVMRARLVELGCPPEKAVVHPLGVDVQSLPSRPRILAPGESLKVLFAGTFREKKGISYLVEAVDHARRAGTRLHLTLVAEATSKPGDFETRQAVFDRIRRLGLEDVVTHRAFVPFAELIRMSLDHHVFVAPSVTAVDGDSEGTPMVIQQMMATSMPVVSTLHSDVPYLFGEQRHLLVPERDPAAIAEHLQRYAEEPARLASDGGALRERISAAFEVTRCAGQLERLYSEASLGAN